MLFCAMLLVGCIKPDPIGTFGYDLEFLKKYKNPIVLKNNNGQCQIAIIPDYQGRIMTSTSKGMKGKSYGWINYGLISSDEFKDHINVFGGEDRFWLGPEGGQYSIFFEKGKEFNLDNWYTPKSIDTEPFSVIQTTDTNAIFAKKMHLTNYGGYEFDIDVKREVSILDKRNIEENLNIAFGDQISYIGFQSENTIKNIGASNWTKEQGLLSVWILGMFIPSENTTVIIPYKDSLDLNTSYFGEIGSDRLSVVNNTVLFKGDGKYRCKIGLPPKNVKPFFGSYDANNEILTIIEYTLEGDTSYVNSLWEHQKNPYGGDVINSYNDGPMENGDLLGPFYELESSSSAKELHQNESIKHTHKTYHFEGSPEGLNAIAEKVLGIDLSKVRIQNRLNTTNRQRYDDHDGYVIGNGKMYLVAGLGKELARIGKSQLTSNKVSLTRISWVIGPTYSIGNLGYGWETIPIIDRDTLIWESEEIIAPRQKYPFWGVESKSKQIHIRSKDILLNSETVFIREVRVSKPENASSSSVQLFIPVYPDPRNGFYGMYDGMEVDNEQVLKWKHACGPNLKPRSSISQDRLMQIDSENKSIVLVGANRALWQEISTTVPDDEIYSKLFPYRAVATTIITDKTDSKIQLSESGFSVDLGNMKPNESCKLYIYIVAEKGTYSDIEKKTLSKLEKWKNQDIAVLTSQSTQEQNDFLFSVQDQVNNPLIQSINSSLNLCKACKPDYGGVMAQPYMYPMYYVRDQFGSFKLFLAAGEYKKAHEILNFYITKQNHEGIQNAHDLFDEPKDPTFWHPDANKKNGHHANAEVPSYIILMAKEYYSATGDINAIEPFYKRLKYNLKVQKLSINGVLPWAGDESYTNNRNTRPIFADEMTDSHLLFLSATDFMKELAETLDKKEDAKEFEAIYKSAKKILFDRMWLADENYFAYSRDTSSNKSNIDKRPAFDLLLRWLYLEMGNPLDLVPQGNLKIVLDQLTNPIRVVPDFNWCAGMDPGYLLYALSRSQHPLTHEAAKLLLNYASNRGLYSEYYKYSHDTIFSIGGTLRPWESAINGFALIQYLSGLRLDMPHKKISIQPHLPPGWNEWRSKKIQLYNEGEIKMELKKVNNEISFSIYRKGGINPVQLNIEFGLFGNKLTSENLNYRNSNQNILFSETEIPVSEDWIELNFRFKINEI